LLAEDAPVVARLQAEQQTLYQANPHEYELLAQYRDQMQMNKLNHISRVWFEIEDFYGVDFTVKENVITLETYPSRYYGISSLMKVLVDLGGSWKKDDANSDNTYPEQWMKLRKWTHYQWHDRPKK
jgi:hypothetical protein